MARPQKTGLDYFPLDTSWDRNMRLVEARYKLLGIGCIVTLYQDIYREGYALKWDEDTRLLFSATHGIDLETIDAVVGFAVEKGLFDKGMLATESVLTSRGIQKRWQKIVSESHRGGVAIQPQLSLLGIKSEETTPDEGFCREETTADGEFPLPETPQSKVKESKEKERREEEPDIPPVLSEWWKSFQRETAILRAPSRGMGSEVEAGIRLAASYDPATLSRAVDYYWTHWRSFWWACRDKRKAEWQREPSHSFKSFASHVDDVIQAMDAPEPTADDVPF